MRISAPLDPRVRASSSSSAGEAKVPRGAAARARSRGRPKGRFTQHRRLEQLRSILEQHPKGLTLYELAESVGVTPRSMRRYLKEVGRELELEPVPTRGGGALRWRIRSGELPRKVELRRTQAYAILAARRLFEPMRGSTLFDEIDMATQRLLALAQRPGRGPNAGLADARLEDRFLYLPVAPKDYRNKTDELDDLFQAVADLRPLKCRYRSGGRDGSEETIVIHPYAMVLHKDAIYCIGFHTGRGEIRTFLLDRMRDTETSTFERFELPEGFRVDDYFQGEFGIFRSAEKARVVIDFDPSVAELVRSRKLNPTQKVTSLEGGGVRLTLTVGDLRELTSWLLSWGKTARAVEPEELVRMVRGELEGALGKYPAGLETAGEPLPRGGSKRGAGGRGRGGGEGEAGGRRNPEGTSGPRY